MYKASIVGIDNTGKTSVVQSIDEVDGVSTIHLTTYQNNDSKIARHSGRLVNSLTVFGEAHDLKSLTGFAYFLHLFPYKFEEMAKNSSAVLVSDRDPIVDTLCYSDFYLPQRLSRIIRSPLRFALEHTFRYPDSFIYLEATPEVSVSRNSKQSQTHERIEALSRLKHLFDKEIFSLEHQGIPVVRIDTNSKPLEGVVDEVRYHLKTLL